VSAYQTSGFAYQGAGQFAYQTDAGDTATRVSGVKRRKVTVNLSDLKVLDRESTADFIKSRLNLKKSEPDDVDLKVVKPRKYRVKKGDEHAEHIRQQEEALKAASVAHEERQKEITMKNNAIIIMLLAGDL